uniref:Uncharacterized protein n=1 Tax=Oryza barthii TaxID=65489 RepID=A0A0D3FBB5_9ORYZ
MGGKEEDEAAGQGKAAAGGVRGGGRRGFGRSAAMASGVKLWAAMLREEETGARGHRGLLTWQLELRGRVGCAWALKR